VDATLEPLSPRRRFLSGHTSDEPDGSGIKTRHPGRSRRVAARASQGRIELADLMSAENGTWPDLAGRIVEDADGRRHVLPVRVYFEDTDFSGIVYHATYLRWCERGRSDYLRLLGNDHRALITGTGGREPAAFVVRRMKLEYLKPARIDEILQVNTHLREIGAASLTLFQTITREGAPLFEAEVLVVLVSVSGKPLRISQAVRSAFEPRP